MEQVSIINKEEKVLRVAEGNKAQDGTNVGAIAGAATGGVMGLIVGMGTAALIPGVGPLVLLGQAAIALTTTLTSGVIGATAGGLLGGLVGYGIPEDQAKVYTQRINIGEYFVMVEGTEAEVRLAESILTRWNVKELRIYDSEVLAS